MENEERLTEEEVNNSFKNVIFNMVAQPDHQEDNENNINMLN